MNMQHYAHFCMHVVTKKRKNKQCKSSILSIKYAMYLVWWHFYSDTRRVLLIWIEKAESLL